MSLLFGRNSSCWVSSSLNGGRFASEKKDRLATEAGVTRYLVMMKGFGYTSVEGASMYC